MKLTHFAPVQRFKGIAGSDNDSPVSFFCQELKLFSRHTIIPFKVDSRIDAIPSNL